MTILALEFSSARRSVALARGGVLLAEAGETEDRGDPPHETAAGTTVLPAADPWANPPADPPADDSIDSAADASHADSAQPGPPAPAKEEPRHPPE